MHYDSSNAFPDHQSSHHYDQYLGLMNLVDSLLDAMELSDQEAYDLCVGIAISRMMDIRRICRDDLRAFLMDAGRHITDIISSSLDDCTS